MAEIKCIDRTPTDEQHERNIAVIERYCITSDEDGYNYVIPVYKLSEFHAWVALKCPESKRTELFRFEDCRIDGGLLTFTDPKVG